MLIPPQRGSMLVLFAGLIIILTGFAVLAVDVGRIFIVRNELQNVADSAALAGANCLTRKSMAGSPSECTAEMATSLNWAQASAKAESQLGQNSADNHAVATTGSGRTVEVGYWIIPPADPAGAYFAASLPAAATVYRPAVRVVVRKGDGMNGGPVTMLTAAMYGGSHVNLQAEAVAVISPPGSVPPASVVPQVINKCMYDKFWNSDTGTPRIYTGTPPDPYGLSTIGQPWVVRIGSAYHYDTCQSGQWTSFDQDVNSQAAIGDLIANGNPVALDIGDLTWIEPGTKTASYFDLDAKYPTPPGADVTMLVVDTADLSNKGEVPIVAFAGFRITDVQGGSGKYIQGHFIPHFITPGSSGSGPFYGTYTPPRLAR